jgi:hypothetical protein
MPTWMEEGLRHHTQVPKYRCMGVRGDYTNGPEPIPGRIVRILALEVDVGDPAWSRGIEMTKVQLSQGSINTYFRACCVTPLGGGGQRSPATYGACPRLVHEMKWCAANCRRPPPRSGNPWPGICIIHADEVPCSLYTSPFLISFNILSCPHHRKPTNQPTNREVRLVPRR